MFILVTGGTGYIGSHVVHLLAQISEFKVVVVDNNRNYNRNILPPQVPFFNINTGDREALNKVFKKFPIEAVMHFAAFIEAGESVHYPLKYFKNNFSATLNLLETALNHNCRKIIFSSTAAVYGEPKYTPLDEDHPPFPINPYGQSKLMVEEVLKNLEKSDQMKFISFRYFNAGGNVTDASLGEYHDPETHLIPILLQTALRTRDCFYLFGNDYPTEDGTCIRDYIHVLDLAQAHIDGLKYLISQQKSQIFNLGSQRGFSNLEVYKKACSITKQKIKLRIKDRRPGDPSVLIASSKKAREILSWHPRYSDLETIISSAWKWQLKVRKICKDLDFLSDNR